MGCSTLADERATIPGRRLKDRYTEAPRLQVIGFDLPATAAGKSGLALDSDDDDDDGFGAAATAKSTNINTDTSPRSALQKLLLPTVAHSDPTPAFPAHNTVSLSHGPSFLVPAAKQTRVEMAALTSKPCTVVGRMPTMPVTALNWPASKGIAELITRPSLHSSSIHDRHRDCSPPVMVVGKLNHSGKSESHWDANNQLPEESKKSIGMEGDVMESPCGLGSCSDMKRNFVEIDAKQTSIHIQDKCKKISLFILAASSPIAECGDQCCHCQGADQYKSQGINMEFLNSCHLCKRPLGQGHDIFMYSGDKAFCSMECRYQQMVIDERKERRTPLVIRAGSSPAYRSYMASPTGNAIIDQTGATTPISISRPNFMNPAAAA